MERLFPFEGKRPTPQSPAEKALFARRAARAPSGQPPTLDGIYLLRFSAGDIDRIAEELRRHPDVVYAHPDTVAAIASNDPGFASQWALQNTGQTYPASGSYNAPPGTPDADMDIQEAWPDAPQDGNVLVAVIDTGVDYNHRDLQGAIWQNEAELAGELYIDDDRNGFVDDVRGYDFTTLGQIRDTDPMDQHGHGTHCAGAIAARRGNQLDIAGVAPEARIMPVRALDSTGEGYVSDLAEAIVYAADNGAEVISNSWGIAGVPTYEILDDAIEYAAGSGCIIFGAAGNNGSAYFFSPAYHVDVIGVTASDSNDEQAPFTNYGCWLDVAAPGVDVLGLRAAGTSRGFVQNEFTTVLSGTSMACPHAAGVAALLLAENPSLNAEDICGLLKATSDPIHADEYIGQGRINAKSALQHLESAPVARLEWKDFEWNEVTCRGEMELRGTATAPDFDRFEIWWGEGATPTTWHLAETRTAPVQNGVLVSDFDTVPLWRGLFSIRLSVYGEGGLRADSAHLMSVKNCELRSPMHNDVIGLDGEPLPIVVGLPEGTSMQSIAWGLNYNPSVWSTQGVTVLDGTNDLWGTLDTAQFSGAVLLNLRFTIQTSAGARSEYVEMFWLDDRMKPGFPVYVPMPPDSVPGGGMCDVVVEDIDRDGSSEIALVDSATTFDTPVKLMLYESSGQLRNELPAPTGGPPWSDKPAIGNLDGTGDLEIVLQLGTNSVQALDSGGDVVPGQWPAPSEDKFLQKVAADLDRDGTLETFWDSFADRDLVILGADGSKLSESSLEFLSHGFDPEPFPTVGQFDDDVELEIAIRYSLTKVAVMDPDGTLLPGWPFECTGFVNDLAVGDLDNDGNEELVVLAGLNLEMQTAGAGLYMFERDGTLMAPPPAELGAVPFQYTAAALGDMDADEDLEIVFASYNRLFAYHHTGQKATGSWPKQPGNAWFTRGPQIADLTGDGIPDVFAAGGGMNQLFSNGTDPSSCGGLFAWKFDGTAIDLNPHPSTTTLLLPDGSWSRSATACDIDGNGLLDIVVSSFWERGHGKLSPSVDKRRSAIYAFEFPVAWNPAAAHWPMPRKNPRSSSNYEGIDVVPLATQAPLLHPEPETTEGTANLVEWDPLWFATAYFVEADDEASFASPLGNSGWITSTSYLFQNLPGDAVYFRVRGRYETSLRTVQTVWSETESTRQLVPSDLWLVH